MMSYTPVNVVPGPLAPGDGYVLAGHVTRFGDPDGLSTAQCTYTDTAGPVLKVCTVNYALNNDLIVTSGYIQPWQGRPGHAGHRRRDRCLRRRARVRHAAAHRGRQPRDPAPVRLT